LHRNHTLREIDHFGRVGRTIATSYANQSAFKAELRGESCRDVRPAIASSVSSVIVGGATNSVRKIVSMISLPSDPIRSAVSQSGSLATPIASLQGSHHCGPLTSDTRLVVLTSRYASHYHSEECTPMRRSDRQAIRQARVVPLRFDDELKDVRYTYGTRHTTYRDQCPTC
jgi:hypothetical protein